MTHGVLTGTAVDRVTASPLKMLTLTDSIPATEAMDESPNIRQISTANLLARA